MYVPTMRIRQTSPSPFPAFGRFLGGGQAWILSLHPWTPVLDCSKQSRVVLVWGSRPG